MHQGSVSAQLMQIYVTFSTYKVFYKLIKFNPRIIFKEFGFSHHLAVRIDWYPSVILSIVLKMTLSLSYRC